MRQVYIDGKCYECGDYRPLIEQFIPEILSLINHKEDERIQERFLDRMLVIHRDIDTVGKFTTTLHETTFFDIVFDATELAAGKVAIRQEKRSAAPEHQ